jgi:Fe-S-cluster containining protein
MKYKKITIKINQNGLPQELNLIIPNGDILFTDLIPSIYRLFDQILTMELKKYPIICKKGCSQCCQQLVPISIPEVFYLNSFVQSLPINRQNRIGVKLTAVLNCVETAGIFDQRTGPINYRSIDRAYFDLNLSCPFLENGCCSIYKHRPFACREYNVNSDPQNCVNPYQNEVEKVKIKRNIGALIAAFTGRLYGLPPFPIPLVLFQNWANQNKALGNVKWSGIWLFEKIADCLVGLNDEELGISYQIII